MDGLVRKLMAAIRYDVELRHSLFSVLLSVTLTHVLMDGLVRKLMAAIRYNVELRHSLFSVLLSVTLTHVTYVFIPTERQLLPLIISVPLSATLSVLACGWRARWNVAQASLLGSIFSLSLLCCFTTRNVYLAQFARYLMCIAAFHYGEFLATALTNRADLDLSSYLLDHSLAYWAAAALSWVEYVLEVWYLPVLKNPYVSYAGLVPVICGDCLRKLAMAHAKGGFTHQVAVQKRSEHRLITDGVYGLVRHPGYLGWLIWSLGTQVTIASTTHYYYYCCCYYYYYYYYYYRYYYRYY
ncbi:unnamed protein product [Gongylonema pulchrum]|uniref:Protein-S-isoprenylcysteine O-methyltransferase n=1 Tax=Gongylonema pulchrum TaxID=637853 RepID=A0A183F0Z6_9BILA|nr:unnamed protein product [Gongylonema pulchrum]